jgi:hypothetical protein
MSTWGAPFWARPSWMLGRPTPRTDSGPPPCVFSAGHPWPCDPRPCDPPSSPSPPPSQLKGGGTSGSGRPSRDTQPACLSGRPFGRVTGTLLPRRSQEFRRRSNDNSSRWAGCPPPTLLPHATALRGSRCCHTQLPVSSTPANPPPIRRGTHSLHGTVPWPGNRSRAGGPDPLGHTLRTGGRPRSAGRQRASLPLAPCVWGSCP